MISPEHYEKNGYPHAEWTYLRKHAPVYCFDRGNFDPFWAITKHADIVEIGKNPTDFIIEPRIAVFTRDVPRRHDAAAPSAHDGSARAPRLPQR